MWQRTLSVQELSEGSARGITTNGWSVCLALVDSEPRAIEDVCPHRGASLSEGLLRDGCVTCPSHLWRFSLTDGAKQGDDRVRVRTFPARVVDGFVEVDLPPRAAERSLREILLAHARGESIEEGIS